MISLLLAVHNHQPVGNFGHIFSRAFKECYWPLLNTLAEFPKIKISLHHSGPLLDWAQENEPDYIPTLVKLIKKGQIEPLGGGYYEPILAVIPPDDARGQIQMMQDFWESKCGRKPRGIWMTERIWEPSLTTILADNKIEYTILDDEHFRAAGIVDEFILNYHLTERHGKTVAIFASDQTLRYQIPFKQPEDVIAHLLAMEQRFKGSAITYGDDGEKFGMWPGTFEWVVQKGWLRKFFALLTENSEKIRCELTSNFLDSAKPSKTVYLPACSYHEMGEWALPANAIHKYEEIKQFLIASGKWEAAKPFLRGGYWDNFLTKYPEANYMHKKMLYVSEKISKQEKTNEEAKKSLYRAQCNCAYWHGLFGGLYLNYLRSAVFKNLIEAENILEPKKNPSIEIVDIDCDKSDELIFSNREIIAVVKPGSGGSLIEFSHRKSGLNLQDVLSRKEEAYHNKSSQTVASANKKDETSSVPSIHDISRTFDSCGKITYDPCARHSFCDHLWPAEISTDKLDAGKGHELNLLCNLPFKIDSCGQLEAVLKARYDNLEISKKYSICMEAAINVNYNLAWQTPLQSPLRLGSELNLTLLAGHDNSRYYLMPDGERKLMDYCGSSAGMDVLTLVDEYNKFKLNIISNRKMDVWYYPVQTVSQSESGFDLLYQGSCVIWSAIIGAGTKEFDFSISLEFEEI
jgi:alpha-amylase